MRILLWSQHFWPEHFHINEVAQSLTEAGNQVTVLTGKPNYPSGTVFDGYRAWGLQQECHQRVEIVRLPMLPRGKGRALQLAKNYLSFIAAGYFLAPWALRNKDFDVVFVYATSPILQALPALWLARLRKIALVLWVQDLWPEALASTGYVKNQWLLGCVERLVRTIYRKADLLLIPSQAFIPSVTTRGGTPEKIAYHPNSASVAQMPHTIKDSTLALAREIGTQFSVVYAGNLGTVQSLDTVIAAARILQKHDGVHFYLVGNGSMAMQTAEAVARQQLTNISLPGWIAADEVQAIYASASVLLVPLKDDSQIHHTIPNKLQVYLAAGKPIIVSGNGEAARTLRLAQAGIHCPAGDAQALADAVLHLKALSTTERQSLGDNGKSYFKKHFELESMTQNLLQLLRTAKNLHERKEVHDC